MRDKLRKGLEKAKVCHVGCVIFNTELNDRHATTDLPVRKNRHRIADCLRKDLQTSSWNENESARGFVLTANPGYHAHHVPRTQR